MKNLEAVLNSLILTAALAPFGLRAEIASIDSRNSSSDFLDWQIEGIPSSKAQLDIFLKNIKSDALPKFNRIHECVTKTKILMQTYFEIKKYGFGKTLTGQTLVIDASPKYPADYQYETNLVSNFSSLKTSEDAALTSIETFHTSMVLLPGATTGEIKARLTRIDVQISNLSSNLAKSAIREDAFLFLLENSANLLKVSSENNLSELEFLLSDQCKDVPVASVAIIVAKDVADMSSGIEDMKHFVIEARAKRRALVEYLYDYHRYKLTTAYYQNTTDALMSLRDQILSVFATARLVEEMNGWWASIVAMGLADHLHTLYCQYDEPLRRMRATREIAQQYLERVEVFKDAPEGMKAVYRGQALNIISSIDRNIARLVSGGWEAQFNQQKFMVDYMLTISDQYVDSCIPLLDAYKVFSPSVLTAEDFHGAEKKFQELTDTCIAKKARN